MRNIFCEFEISNYNTLCSRGQTKVLALSRINVPGGHLVFQNEAKNIPRQDFMVMNISCKFEKATCNIFLVRAVTANNKGGTSGLAVLYRHIYVVKGTILSNFSRPKVALKTIAKVNKLDAGTPSCTQPPKPFSIVSMQYSQH